MLTFHSINWTNDTVLPTEDYSITIGCYNYTSIFEIVSDKGTDLEFTSAIYRTTLLMLIKTLSFGVNLFVIMYGSGFSAAQMNED